MSTTGSTTNSAEQLVEGSCPATQPPNSAGQHVIPISEVAFRTPRGGSRPSAGQVLFRTSLSWEVWLCLGQGPSFLIGCEWDYAALRKAGQLFIALQATSWLEALRARFETRQRAEHEETWFLSDDEDVINCRNDSESDLFDPTNIFWEDSDQDDGVDPSDRYRDHDGDAVSPRDMLDPFE